MPLRLSFDTGALAGIHIVTAAKSIRLGRDPAQNDILLTNPKVSRRHAVLERMTRGYSMEILGNGPTKLNGDAVTPIAGRATIQALGNGDHVELGGVEFVVAECEVRLICTTGASAGKDILLDGPATIGSGGDCDLVIAEAGVAPLHIEITSTPLGLKVDARVKTTFNGAPADSRMLAHGDEILIGSATLRVNVTVPGESDVESTTIGTTNSATIIVSKDLSAVGELVAIAGSNKGDKIALGDNQIIIGTRDDCTYRVNDLLASPVHCAISKNGDQFVATDLGSETGTYINGERIFKGIDLKPGDLIAIGSSVFESRLIGGVKLEKRAMTSFTMMGDMSKLGGPQPRFVLDGRVISAKKIIIGRAPTCDVIVDGAACSREHCTIEWSSTTSLFSVRDTSAHGTYLDDKRVVKQPLPASGVLRIGDTLFRMAVRGEVCTMERADAALAQAAVDIARQQAADMTRAFNKQAGMTQFGGANMVPGLAMKTMFHMDVGQLEAQIQVRKKDLKKGAPAWRPSSDLQRGGGLRGAIVLALLAALGLCGVATLFGGGKALVNHPLSAAHSSAEFASKSGGATPCSGCHSAGARIDLDRCQTCHTGFTERAQHADLKIGAGKDHPKDCGTCHREHEGAPEGTALGALSTCKQCHAGQHEKEFATKAVEPKKAGPIPPGTLNIVELAAAWKNDQKLPADGEPPANSPAAKLIGLHQTHANASVGCTGCHADASAGPDKLVEFKTPALACFRCHTGGEDPKAIDCSGCHGGEHAQSKPHAPPAVPATVQSSSPLTSIGWAGGLAFVGALPILLFGFFGRIRRSRTSAKMVEDLKSHPAEVVKRLVHSMNDSKCVGCGMCVQACPASVLELVDHKSRVVNFDACIQCKRCESSCAFDALRMHDADKPPPMIPVPSIDAFHETPVPGLFLIGQASGTPQVKNATNLGRAIVQRLVQQSYGPGSGRRVGGEYDVVIVGSGPAGLSAALTCIELGLSYVVLEKERDFSWTIRNYYHKGKEVMAEPNDVALEATLPHWDSKREELLGSWKELIDQNKVDIRFQKNCVDIKKDGDKFNVSTGDGKNPPNAVFTAGRVILAIGTLGNPRTLGCAGDDMEKVKNSLVDPDEWNGKQILVVGGSDSAVEVVLALCKPEKKNTVTFSTRGAKLEGIKPKNRKLIEDALAAGQFAIKYATSVSNVDATSVSMTYKEDARVETIPCDVIFGMVGGNSPQKWLQGIGIPYVEKPHSWSPPRTDLLAQKTAEGLPAVRRLPRREIPQTKPHH
jgi:predicted CXXCH cytochrome family protein